MLTLVQSPFFVLFCAASAVGAYLAHRFLIVGAKPGTGERGLAFVAALLTLSLSIATYQIRTGTSRDRRIDPEAASVVTTLTGIGVAFVCLECVFGGDESAD